MKFLFLSFILSFLLHVGTNLCAQNKLTHPTEVAKGRSDGRFTIGIGEKKLMYGYPVPFSTSHFVVAFKEKIKGKLTLIYASNSPHFHPEKVHYITAKPVVKGTSAAPFVETIYTFKDIVIKQKLTPIGKNFKPTDLKGLAQFYKIEYEITNNAKDEIVVGISMLFDTMINENDACQFEVNGKKINTGTAFKDNVPKEMLIYETANSKKDMLGQFITFKPELDVWQPDELYVSNWNNLHEVIWDVDTLGGQFKDSAVLLKWNGVKIKPKKQTNFATLYGTPIEKAMETKLLINDLDMLDEKKVFYYAISDFHLTDSNRLEMDTFIKSKKIVGATVHGHSDAIGTEEAAEKISWKRIEEIKIFLQKYQIPIISKPHGKEEADLTKKEGSLEDRKAVVVFFYKK